MKLRTFGQQVSGWGFLVAMGLAAGGCAQAPNQTPEKGVPAATVSYPIERLITDYAEYTGRTAAIESVQIRARVSGYLEKINFKEGTELDEGETLYEIDARPYQAAQEQAKAAVEEQTAKLKYQQAVYERDRRLIKKEAVSLETLQQDQSARDTAAATLKSAQAKLITAALNVEWTKVKSPIAGRIGRTLVTKGNLVVADQTVLSTLVSQDPMYAYFDVDEPTVLRVQQLIREGKLASVEAGAKIQAFLELANEHGFPHQGTIDFVNNQFNLGTATLQVRGVFPNPKPPVGVRVLSPGQFVRVRVAVSPPYPALLVSESAVGTDQGLKYVYIVDEYDAVIRRPVDLGTQQKGLVVVAKGILGGDRIIIDGLQQAHPGASVRPTLAPMPEQPASGEGNEQGSERR